MSDAETRSSDNRVGRSGSPRREDPGRAPRENADAELPSGGPGRSALPDRAGAASGEVWYDANGPQRRRFTWNAVLWSLVFPARKQRVAPTVSGVLLILLAFGIGLAAYNASNNILFITLALLLASLIASGILSWLNFRGLVWRLAVPSTLRVGADAAVELVVRNDKRFLPTYGIWFQFFMKPLAAAADARAETTFTARGLDVRAAFARADDGCVRGQRLLGERLDPNANGRVSWSFRPVRRGRARIALESVGSLFPFGFLRKDFATAVEQEVVVWPAAVAYERSAAGASRRANAGERIPRTGAGDDLFALRRYNRGDSHRLIHWKASARLGELLVRQFAAEAAEGFSLWLRTAGPEWRDPAQFELLLSFAVALAQDLFRAGRLTSVALDAEPPVRVRSVAQLESWIDAVAVLPVLEDRNERREPAAGRRTEPVIARRNLVTFMPDGPRGVRADVEGVRLACV